MRFLAFVALMGIVAIAKAPAATHFQELADTDEPAVTDKSSRLPAELPSDPQPVGTALSLADLQKLAREHSPVLRQAAGDLEAAEGARIEAAICNNPPYISSMVTIGADDIKTMVITMGKRKLAAASAWIDVENARLAYRRAEADLMATVRSNLYQVLVHEERMKANRRLMEVGHEVYRMVEKREVPSSLKTMRFFIFAAQARIAYIQSRAGYKESWKVLAASIGRSEMPLNKLSGSITSELPRFDFEKSVAHVLKNHTEALCSENGVLKARLNLRLREVTAPEVSVGVRFWSGGGDSAIPRFVPSLPDSLPVPVFDSNKESIKSARAALLRALEQPRATQNALTASFADAYRRMEENRVILELYRKQLLPQQAQALRSAVADAQIGAAADAEQNLMSLIDCYFSTVSNYWQAVSDTANLLQTDDAFQMADQVDKLPDSDVCELLNLPIRKSRGQ